MALPSDSEDDLYDSDHEIDPDYSPVDNNSSCCLSSDDCEKNYSHPLP